MHMQTDQKQCQKRKYMCVYAEIWVCICGNICVYMRKYMCVYAHIYDICRYMQISTCINIDIHMNTYTHRLNARPHMTEKSGMPLDVRAGDTNDLSPV